MTPLWFLKETFMTSVKKSFHIYFFVNQDLSFLGGNYCGGSSHVHTTNGIVNGVPTRQIFRPIENGHVFFFCVRAAGVARPSFKWRSPYSRFAVDVVENLLRVVMGSPALEQFRIGRLPPSDDSLVGPLARHLAGSRLQSCLLTENCCRP